MDEFSFKINNIDSFEQNQNSDRQFMSNQILLSKSSNHSLRDSLYELQKSDIIQLLIEQINSNKLNSTKKYKQNIHQDYQQKYFTLVKDFEEYITNTNTAQEHYIRTITELRKDRISSHKQTIIQLEKNSLIEKLQETVENYLQINNELNNKVNRLTKELNQYQSENQKIKLQNEEYKSIINQLKEHIQERRSLTMMMSTGKGQLKLSKQSQFNPLSKQQQQSSVLESSSITSQKHNIISQSSSQYNFVSDDDENVIISFNQNDDFTLSTFRILQISNKQLQMNKLNLQRMLSDKNQKIRKLIAQNQKLTEEKLKFKQQIIEIKSKQNIYSSKSNHQRSKNNVIQQNNSECKNVESKFIGSITGAKRNIQNKLPIQSISFKQPGSSSFLKTKSHPNKTFSLVSSQSTLSSDNLPQKITQNYYIQHLHPQKKYYISNYKRLE